jgi:hypothetical protein
MPSQLNRITLAVANGGCILPSIVSGEAAWIVFVVNDSANTIKVGAFAGETINSVSTATDLSAGVLSIPSGQSGIFIPVPNSKGATTDWRSAVIP